MKRAIALISVTTLLAFMALTVSPTASAQSQAGIPIPATCTTPGGAPIDCALRLIGFQNVGGTLNAAFLLVNEATGQATRVLIPIGQLVPDAMTCTILHLVIPGPITLELLGLELTIQTIDILLEARQGTLLGDLLCGLFFNSPNFPGLLTAALRQGLITV